MLHRCFVRQTNPAGLWQNVYVLQLCIRWLFSHLLLVCDMCKSLSTNIMLLFLLSGLVLSCVVRLVCQSVMCLIHAEVCFYCYIISAYEYRPAYLCHTKLHMLCAKRLHRKCKHYFHVVKGTNRKMKVFVKPHGLNRPCPDHNVFFFFFFFPQTLTQAIERWMYFSVLKWSLSKSGFHFQKLLYKRGRR